MGNLKTLKFLKSENLRERGMKTQIPVMKNDIEFYI